MLKKTRKIKALKLLYLLTRSLRYTLHGSRMLNDANWRHVPCYLMDYNLVSVTIKLLVFCQRLL